MTDQNEPIITPEARARLSRYRPLDWAVAAAKRHPLVTVGIGFLLFVLLVNVLNTSNDADLGLVLRLMLLFGGIGMFIYFARRGHQIREAERAIQKVAQSQPYEGSQISIKTYEGSQAEAMRHFQADADYMDSENYFPTSQSWAPGQWSGGAFAVAILLILFFGLGILILAYMLIVKPDGTLTVTYERRAASFKEKTCPECAEKLKRQP